MYFLAAAVVSCAVLGASPLSSPPGAIVFYNMSEGYHTFRIPNLVSLRGGVLLAHLEAPRR
jgi:hypothetical protein